MTIREFVFVFAIYAGALFGWGMAGLIVTKAVRRWWRCRMWEGM